MKTIKKLSLLFGAVLCISALLFISCQKESIDEIDTEQQINSKSQIGKDEATIIDDLLADLKPTIEANSKKIGDFEVMTFEIVRNNNTGVITVENLKAEAFFPINQSINKSGYQVDCDLGGDGSNDWSQECSGAYSCGKLAKKCLDAGGCATACAQKNDNASINSVKMIYTANLK